MSGVEYRLYLVLVAVHVLSAIGAFGIVFAMPVIRRQLTDDGQRARLDLALARRVLTPAMGLLLLTGIVQVAWGPRGFGEPWVASTFLVLLVLFGIAGAGITRTAKALADGGPDPEGRLGFRLGIMWQLSALLVVAAVIMMVVKPGG
jgi:uncharacterized membrane protein